MKVEGVQNMHETDSFTILSIITLKLHVESNNYAIKNKNYGVHAMLSSLSLPVYLFMSDVLSGGCSHPHLLEQSYHWQEKKM